VTALAALVAGIGGVAGATLLRRAWADQQRERVGLIVSVWAVFVGTLSQGYSPLSSVQNMQTPASPPPPDVIAGWCRRIGRSSTCRAGS